jgi:hypothetical protein
MAFSLSARLGLKRPLSGHGFNRQESYDNLTVLDAYPGIYPCTLATRPVSWGAAHNGMHIFEMDTLLTWRWSGSAFVRTGPLGLLAAITERSTDFSTAATSPTTAMTVGATVPATNVGSTTKRIKVEANWYAIVNATDTTLGAAEVSLIRDGATLLCTQRVTGRPSTDTDYLDWGQGGTIVGWDNPAAGAHTYTLAINSIAAVGGTTVLKASATQVAQMAVSEVGL